MALIKYESFKNNECCETTGNINDPTFTATIPSPLDDYHHVYGVDKFEEQKIRDVWKLLAYAGIDMEKFMKFAEDQVKIDLERRKRMERALKG